MPIIKTGSIVQPQVIHQIMLTLADPTFNLCPCMETYVPDNMRIHPAARPILYNAYHLRLPGCAFPSSSDSNSGRAFAVKFGALMHSQHRRHRSA